MAEFGGLTRRLRVENNLTLEHSPLTEPEVLLEDRARFYPFSYDAEEMPDLSRSIERHHSDPHGELDRWVRSFVHQGRPTETAGLLMTSTTLPIKTVDGATITIRQGAHVRDGYPPQTNIVRVDGHRAVLMGVLKNGQRFHARDHRGRRRN